MVTKKELMVQIAIGTISDAKQLAGLVKITADVEVLSWAMKHKYSPVRIAAITNSNCPIGFLLEAFIMEEGKGAREALDVAVQHRREEFEYLVRDVVRCYPQLALDLKHDSSN